MKHSKFFKEDGTGKKTWLQQVLEELLAAEYFCRKVWYRLLFEYKLLMLVNSVLRLRWNNQRF